jgi:hypothetical protein
MRRCPTWLAQGGRSMEDLSPETSMTNKTNPRDQQAPNSGKVANDANKLGEQTPTQKNEGKRTPESRSDRESQVGSGNQSQSRRGGAGSGH